MTEYLDKKGLAYYTQSILNYSKFKIIKQTDTSVTIAPNVLNVWDNVEELNISFKEGDPEEVCEYMIQFSCGDVPAKLSLPENIKWSDEPEFESNHTYQISILNNLAIFADWSN